MALIAPLEQRSLPCDRRQDRAFGSALTTGKGSVLTTFDPCQVEVHHAGRQNNTLHASLKSSRAVLWRGFLDFVDAFDLLLRFKPGRTPGSSRNRNSYLVNKSLLRPATEETGRFRRSASFLVGKNSSLGAPGAVGVALTPSPVRDFQAERGGPSFGLFHQAASSTIFFTHGCCFRPSLNHLVIPPLCWCLKIQSRTRERFPALPRITSTVVEAKASSSVSFACLPTPARRR